ncbi:sensor histidine kinase [Streptococcus equi]|uniref:GHKL domain-containing protein n=1 Tax=Streptococcus equi subsp. ruminatorum TaxID=254358 RepID=A0A6M1KQ50_9STRE|nr:GHKL domain-containing protein [Streptococcus equi]NGL84033.1 GHKL domain-containing protein [Streptococcus equi subsp. ruminatorum]
MNFIVSLLFTVVHTSILILIHAKVFGNEVTLKKLILSTIAFFLWSAVLALISESLADDLMASLLLYPTYFMLYTYYLIMKKIHWTFLIFYSLFSIAFWDVVHSFIRYFIISNIPLLNKDDGHMVWFTSIIAGLLVLLLFKLFKYDFSHLRQKNLTDKVRITLYLANASMFFYYMIIPFISEMERMSSNDLSHYKELITAIYFILFICFVNVLDRNLKQELQEKMILQKEIQLQNITNYSQQIERLYQDVRGFRHDYINILTSLKIGIDSQDMSMISDVYQSVLKDSAKALRGKKFDVARLRNILDLPLKSLLISKLSEAQSLFIPVSLEIENPISVKNMEQIDFLTVVSILLDNAVEAAAEVIKEAGIVVCFFEEPRNRKQIFIIQNSTKEKQVDVSLIFKRGMSSKGEERGIGLSNVKEILKSYPKTSLRTLSDNFVFQQILEIEI